MQVEAASLPPPKPEARFGGRLRGGGNGASTVLRALGFSVLLVLAGVTAAAAPPARYRGTPVAWARLRTDSFYWDRHALYDSLLIDFIRDHTTLDVDETPRTVSAASLDELCACPLIFVANLHTLPPEQRRNLAEYLRRGGFIIMDICLEPAVTPNRPKELAMEEAVLASEFPHLRISPLRPDHPIYSAYFDLTGRPKLQAFENTPGWTNAPGNPFEERIGVLAGIYDGTRMIGILSIAGLECDLAGFERFASPTGAAEILTNIYIYALTGNRAP